MSGIHGAAGSGHCGDELPEPLGLRLQAPLPSRCSAPLLGLGTMKEHLPKEVFKSLKKTVESGAVLDIKVADVVAAAMKDWAIRRGAPRTTPTSSIPSPATAEKHDSFLSPDGDGGAIAEFSGKD